MIAPHDMMMLSQQRPDISDALLPYVYISSFSTRKHRLSANCNTATLSTGGADEQATTQTTFNLLSKYTGQMC